ncbi:hypothetical protein [Litoribrevibacter albus]|uniref:TerB family tellurite resistance protein n=1 Tax=Litoribrevibacter albus TaxID=1473156 RepID=A0AA37S781_9GAMM|nr:hypothetical protein [Litoribrevibacter albus]GLQ30366.1 hypothetical protein GCM10007876_08440 [Litoribrevibacter albus]
MNILDIVEKSLENSLSFDNHPAKALSFEERILYLNGLALVINVDDEIHQSELDYLKVMIRSLDIDISTYDDFVDFAKAPDLKTLEAFWASFKRRPIAQVFLFDALMMAFIDDKEHENEKLLLSKFGDGLEITKATQEDIYDLFCHIKHKDWELSSLYFSSHLLNPDHFKHLLDYYEVDLSELLDRTQELRKALYLERFSKLLDVSEVDVRWKDLPESSPHYKKGFRQITEGVAPKLDLKSLIVNEELLPFLQSKLDRQEIRIGCDDKVYCSDGSIYFNLNASGFGYSKESRYFYLYEISDKDILLVERLIIDLLSHVLGDALFLDSSESLDRILDWLWGCEILKGSAKSMSKGEIYVSGGEFRATCSKQSRSFDPANMVETLTSFYRDNKSPPSSDELDLCSTKIDGSIFDILNSGKIRWVKR